ncbi:MAG: hypothetical protein HY706_00400 [Candidatus Hydrogenedentes bacterium]|nr:hypothetical protein [Candidatus Hydrogenedentota bacterium]
MSDWRKVAVLENEVEARLLEAILKEQGIPHIIQSYYDAALDGIFQLQKGWGCVQAAVSDEAELLRILTEIREQAAGPFEELTEAEEGDPE